MISITLLAFSLAALGATQRSTVSLFLPDADAQSLVASIAGSVRYNLIDVFFADFKADGGSVGSYSDLLPSPMRQRLENISPQPPGNRRDNYR